MRLGGKRGRDGTSGGHRARRAAPWLCAAAAIAVAGLPLPAAAQRAGTAAGTVVTNTAELRWTAAGQAGATPSNTDRLIVAERLDVGLALAPRGDGFAFDLTNAGNGEEAFALVATPVDDPAQVLAIVIDVDGDGRCDAAVDRPLAAGRTAPLAPGATLRLLACAADRPARVVARAVTGAGTPGTGFDGQGDGGGDAVVGPTGATASLALGGDRPGTAGAAPTLVKSQAAIASDGSARAAAGSIVTYTLDAGFAAATADVVVEDPIPAGTHAVAGSLALDGVGLSDAADDDAGEIADGVVRVRLGDVAAGSDRRITFAVTVDP